MNFIDYSQLEINKIRIEGGRRDFVCLRSFHRNGVGNRWWDLRKGEILKNVRASVSRLFEAKHCVYPRLLSGGGTGSRLRYNVESGPPFPRNRLLSPRVGRRVERKVLCEPRCSSTRYTAAIRTFLADKKARLPASCCTQPKGGWTCSTCSRSRAISISCPGNIYTGCSLSLSIYLYPSRIF